MELRNIKRYTGQVIYNEDTGLNELETETVLQFRESVDSDWTDVVTVDETL